jgi:hypothetical protein
MCIVSPLSKIAKEWPTATIRWTGGRPLEMEGDRTRPLRGSDREDPTEGRRTKLFIDVFARLISGTISSSESLMTWTWGKLPSILTLANAGTWTVEAEVGGYKDGRHWQLRIGKTENSVCPTRQRPSKSLSILALQLQYGLGQHSIVIKNLLLYVHWSYPEMKSKTEKLLRDSDNSIFSYRRCEGNSMTMCTKRSHPKDLVENGGLWVMHRRGLRQEKAKNDEGIRVEWTLI